MPKVNLAEKFGPFDDHWNPRVVGEINDSFVKLAKFKGEFVWHQHKDEDELFLVVQGELLIRLRNDQISLKEGEFFIVPRGVEHLHSLIERPACFCSSRNRLETLETQLKNEPGRLSNESDSPD